MGMTLNGPFMEVVGIGRYNVVKMSFWFIVSYLNKAVDIGEWPICGGDRLVM